jgi:6,7-dimethyl-8-ribityllumazine synthase
MKGIEPRTFDGAGLRIAVVSTRWNAEFVDQLVEGARATLLASGMSSTDITEYRVPGAFELPLAARLLADTGRVDAVVCLGAVIRGETPHFDFVAGEAARGIMAAGLDTGIPVSFGVITADTDEQAAERSGGRAGNKGSEAAEAAVEMALFRKKVVESVSAG